MLQGIWVYREIALRGLCPACLWSSVLDGNKAEERPRERAVPDAARWRFTIPGYEILEEIARGGMGIVYRVREKEAAREVALKMLLPFQAFSVEMRDRFRQEIRAAASLDHPNILPVYRTGEQDGLPFFTMKLAIGGTLAERVQVFQGRHREIAGLMAAVAQAVHAAHQRGILHRDLKPSNILFDEADHPYVADFGLAKLTQLDERSTPEITRSAALLGTPHYMAPEVAEQGARGASIASDVYGLGAVLYQLLAGRPPSRSIFPPGVTEVTCVATDACRNTSTCSFDVSVRPAGVTIERAVILRWECGRVLQEAPMADGPWTDIPGAASPYCVPAAAASRFYRVRD